GGAEWEVAVGNSRNKQDGFGYNYVIVPLLQRAIDSGVNPFDYEEVVAASSTFATTIINDNAYRDRFADARLSWDIADIGGRAVGFVIGGEYHDINYRSVTDQQSQAGQVVGSSGATSGGTRNWHSGYVETLLPVLDTLEISLAGRFDAYSDFGNEFSPKLSVAWRPNDTVLLRANIGEGFKAPNMDQLYSAPSQSFNTGRDRRECANLGIDPFSADCANVQRETFLPSNPEVEAETASQWTVGGVWNPVGEFSVAMDYYSIEIDNQIRRLTTQDVLDAEYRCVVENRTEYCDTSFWGSVNRSNVGGIIVTRPLANTAAIATDGIDMDIAYRFDTGFGMFSTEFGISKIFSFETEAVPGSGLVDNITYRGFPDLRANASIVWDLGAFNAAIIGNYTDGWQDCPAPVAATDPENPECATNEPISSFTTWNVQAGYELPWDARLSIGVRNALDRKAELQANGALDPTHMPGLFGRTLYASFEQRF
ncbi:MAG TPA: TonB-dependent receptor, partial [Gammaproteobacteria bacterium]